MSILDALADHARERTAAAKNALPLAELRRQALAMPKGDFPFAAALKKQGIDIDKRKISIKGEVTGTGTYEAVIKVHPSITSTIKINVVAG